MDRDRLPQLGHNWEKVDRPAATKGQEGQVLVESDLKIHDGDDNEEEEEVS